MHSDDSGTARLAALQEEIAELTRRNALLEATMVKYRLQMHGITTSLSWRVTHPLRQLIARGRRLRTRLRRLPTKVRNRNKVTVLTAGLFFPDVSTVPGWVDSPLLAKPIGDGIGAPQRTAPPATATVLVVAHVYYPDLWPDIAKRITRIPEQFDLVVTLVDGKADELFQEIREQFPQAHVLLVDNRGRDIGPLVALANDGWFQDYEAVLKVHTKRSPHLVDGDVWRSSLLDGLLMSGDSIARILELMRTDRDVGVISAPGSYEGGQTWGSNLEIAEALAARLPLAFDPDALRFPAGSMYWIRPFLLQRLADLGLAPGDFAREADLLDGTTPHAVERFLGVMAVSAGLVQLETTQVARRLPKVRSQQRAVPRVFALYVPHLQQGSKGAHRGVIELLHDQALLAKDYGVDGFVVRRCWSDRKRSPGGWLDEVLAHPEIQWPFALCWTNDPACVCGDCRPDALAGASFTLGWEERLFNDLLPALSDERYLRSAGLPLLVIDPIGHIPDPAGVASRLRSRAERAGLGGLRLLGISGSEGASESGGAARGWLDGLVRLPPESGIGLHPLQRLSTHSDAVRHFSYDAAVDGAELSAWTRDGLRIHPGVMTGWDDTARSGVAGMTFLGANPLTFRRWLARAISAAAAERDEPLVFINAWNDWANGASLEPDARFGRARLEAVADATGRSRVTSGSVTP